jgi:hypothetical protein
MNPERTGMAFDHQHHTLSPPRVFITRMIVFLIIVSFGILILSPQIASAFMSNPGLNGLIVGTLLLGMAYCFRQVYRLHPEVQWVNSYRISDPGLAVESPPKLLAPMATMLKDRRGPTSLTTTSMRSLLDSIGIRLDETRDISHYMIGLLIFLGLLGTFWGLLETVSSVSSTIRALDVSTSESGVIFEELKTGLEAPLKGMGTAFSSSLFGLAGSLILGFLDLQSSQAQNRFYQELEDWLSTITNIDASEGTSQTPSNAISRSLMRIEQDLNRIDNASNNTGNTQSTAALEDLVEGVQSLIGHMREEQKVVREWAQAHADYQAQIHMELKSVIKQIPGAGTGAKTSSSNRRKT